MLGSSQPEVFYKKVALKNFGKFTGKHLRRILILKSRRKRDLMNKGTPARVFSYEFSKIFRVIFFLQDICERPLL